MKLVRTIVFILLFAAVAAVYIYQTRLTKQALTNVPDEVNRSVVIMPDDAIDRITLVDHVQKTRIELRKENGTWALGAPVRYPAESRIADGFVAAARKKYPRKARR